GRAAPLGRLQARDLVGAQNDRLGDRGAGGAAECRGENVAVGFVPGTGKGGGNEHLCLRECARGKNGSCAKRRGSSEQTSAIHGPPSSAVHFTLWETHGTPPPTRPPRAHFRRVAATALPRRGARSP